MFLGVYFRPEGKHFIMGGADDDAQIDDFNVDHHLFEEKIWPTMSQRIKGFDSLKVCRCADFSLVVHIQVLSEWAGHYEYNLFDQNAFIGHYPFIDNLVLANGFSGHGTLLIWLNLLTARIDAFTSCRPGTE
jgi:glycine/D-amino acid oxidase-like deaminating enzyme